MGTTVPGQVDESAPEVVLEANGVSKSFFGAQALSDVSFDVRAGEVHALLGQDGAGKSTLIKILAGAYSVDHGSVRVRGKVLNLAQPADAQAAGLAFIHQDLNLVSYFNSYENIAMGDTIPRRFGAFVDWQRLKTRAREAASLVDIKFDLAQPVSSLSVPQRQLVAMARALLVDARIIVMDEPTAALGVHEVEQVFRVVRRLREQGRSVVYVTHRLDEVEALADRVTVLRDGHRVGTIEQSQVTSRRQLVKLITGRAPEERISAERSVRDGALMLSARGLVLEPKVHGVDLELFAGEVTGLAGLVGSGRSEIAHMVSGVLAPDSGAVERHDVDAGERLPVALLPEDRQLQSAVETMSIRENMTLASLGQHTRRGFVSRRSERRKVEEFRDKLQIKMGSAERPITDLSGGNQQKLLLAKWLATGARIYILDEPTQGVDVGAQEEIHKHIRALAEKGCAVLFISSDLAEVCSIADRVVVLSQGAVVADLHNSQVTESLVSALAFGAISSADQADSEGLTGVKEGQ